jgi:Flp pilus assembly protein TadG
MISTKSFASDQRGATLLEFAIGATVFLTSMFAVIEFGRVLWVHNALTDAARRGARYAVLQCAPSDAACPSSATSIARIKNVVIYGDPAGGTKPVVDNLGTSNVNVDYSGFGLDGGTVTVSITNYQFQFVLPLVSPTIQMPAYSTTLTGESAGYIPATL